MNGFTLEVITEREVAQHLEISAVAGSLADVLNVAGTDALLAGADTAAGRGLLTGKVGLHGRHTGVDEQQAGIVLRDQGKAGQTQMVFGLKEAQEHLAQFVEAVIGMRHDGLLLYDQFFDSFVSGQAKK